MRPMKYLQPLRYFKAMIYISHQIYYIRNPLMNTCIMSDSLVQPQAIQRNKIIFSKNYPGFKISQGLQVFHGSHLWI